MLQTDKARRTALAADKAAISGLDTDFNAKKAADEAKKAAAETAKNAYEAKKTEAGATAQQKKAAKDAYEAKQKEMQTAKLEFEKEQQKKTKAEGQKARRAKAGEVEDLIADLEGERGYWENKLNILEKDREWVELVVADAKAGGDE